MAGGTAAALDSAASAEAEAEGRCEDDVGGGVPAKPTVRSIVLLKMPTDTAFNIMVTALHSSPPPTTQRVRDVG